MTHFEHDYTALTYEVRDEVGLVTLNNPAQQNPFTPELMADLTHLTRSLQEETNLGAVVITAAGGTFSAGGDIKGMVSGHGPAAAGRRLVYQVHDWFQPLFNLEIPVIAAIDGAAYGGGFAFALACDFVLLSDRARLCCVFSRIGLVPDLGCMYTLPRIVGLQRAKEIMFTNRALSPQECVDLGIAIAIYPPEQLLDEALKLAHRLCQGSTAAIGATKRIVNQSFNLDAAALLEMEAAAQGIFLKSDYHKDAVQRFANKEPLRFNWEQLQD